MREHKSMTVALASSNPSYFPEERNQSRPPRLNQASAIAAETLMNNAGEEGISEGIRLAQSERAVPGGVGAEGPAPYLRESDLRSTLTLTST